MPAFSIIVPAYNSESYIGQCIDSILLQSFSDFELIIVNDGSTDRTPVICEQKLQKDGRIRLFHQNNAGHTAARLTGLRASKGDHILFVDSDDLIEPDTLSICRNELLRSDPDILLFQNKNYYEDDTPLQGSHSLIKEGVYRGEKLEELRDSMALMDEKGHFFPRGLCGKVFRHDLIAGHLAPVPSGIRIGEDMCAVVCSLFDSECLSVIGDELYIYRIRRDSVSRSPDPDAFKRNMICIDYLSRSSLPMERPEIRMQFFRLVVNQMYSAVFEIIDSGLSYNDILREYRLMKVNAICRRALKYARFTDRKLRLKQYILRSDALFVVRLLKKTR